jgi:uncharacterized RDD family membrane protein YckC
LFDTIGFLDSTDEETRMVSPQPAPPVNATGLPPGVEVGGLGKRFLAQLIDRLVPALLAAAAVYLAPRVGGEIGVVIQIAAAVLTLAWWLLVWWGFAERAAGPGMRLMRLQLVGFYDGRPIGWIRFLLRALVLAALNVTGIGLLLMLIFLVMHPRKQGWHDLLVHAVVIKQRALAPPKSKVAAEQRRAPEAMTTAQQDQLAGTPSNGGQPHPSPQPLAPPAGVGGYGPPPVPAGPQPNVAQPYGEPSAGAGPAWQPTGFPPVPTPESDQFRRPQPAGATAPPVPLTPPAGMAAPTEGSVEAAPSAGSATSPAGATNDHIHPGGQNGGRPGDRPPPTEAGSTSAGPVTRVSPSIAVPESSRADGQTGWYAVLDDGREIDVTGLVLLGRNPHAQPGEEDAQLIKIADETRTVSKSHLAIATDRDGAFVVDRGSTNGSTVTTSGGVSTKCRMGERVRVSEGSIVSIGDHWLEIRRRTD